MALKQHDRKYDIVVFGATGYTGQYVAERIANQLPTQIKWAIAGRSREKLENLAAEVKTLNPDRIQPEIETAELNDEDLASLAKSTFILITTVGPYHKYGEIAFKACAENGTHYLDVTGEPPWVLRMIKKYEDTAKKSGALMLPQIGLDSAPADVMTWNLAKTLREELNAKTKDVTVSMHELKAGASGGSLATAFTILDNYSIKEVQASMAPFALSPVPQPYRPRQSILSMLTGLFNVPGLGQQCSAPNERMDGAIVERSWGLLSITPTREDEFYGPKFSFREHMKTRSSLAGMSFHFAAFFFRLFVLGLPPVRRLAHRFLLQPGQGPDRELARTNDGVEYRGVGTPDLAEETGKRAYCRTYFRGGIYDFTALIITQAALMILEEDLELDGGVYTPSFLARNGFIDRLDKAGFKWETKMITV